MVVNIFQQCQMKIQCSFFFSELSTHKAEKKSKGNKIYYCENRNRWKRRCFFSFILFVVSTTNLQCWGWLRWSLTRGYGWTLWRKNKTIIFAVNINCTVSSWERITDRLIKNNYIGIRSSSNVPSITFVNIILKKKVQS